MTIVEQIVILLALCSVPFSLGQTSNLFRCTSPGEDLLISITMAVFQGIMVLLGMVIGRWIIGFSGSAGFALGTATLTLAGTRMVLDARKGEPDDRAIKPDDIGMIMIMGLAASINGFIVAIGLPAFEIPLLLFSLAAMLSAGLAGFLGIKLGKRAANYGMGKYARIAGGVALVVIAVLHIYFYISN
ncbi:MAG: manganese efflux pump MntP family protein [Bacteroidales bacterium]|nr:manganese efflux pump MntP family protein [Bacteroidales bacterium]